jgi:3'(2'), 5'-bisphosphate nucleotidase
LRDRAVERREAGSAYKFCMMLEGEIDIYPRFHPTSEWDTSSGQSLLKVLVVVDDSGWKTISI